MLRNGKAYFVNAKVEHRIMGWGIELIPNPRISAFKQMVRRSKYQLLEKAAGIFGSQKMKKDYSRLLKNIIKAEHINSVF